MKDKKQAALSETKINKDFAENYYVCELSGFQTFTRRKSR